MDQAERAPKDKKANNISATTTKQGESGLLPVLTPQYYCKFFQINSFLEI